MLITREMIISRLAAKTNYYKRDIRTLMYALDEVVKECYTEVTADEEVNIQMVEGIKVGCKVVPPRKRVDPRDYSEIIVGETVKPFTKFSEGFREFMQNQYESKKSEEN